VHWEGARRQRTKEGENERLDCYLFHREKKLDESSETQGTQGEEQTDRVKNPSREA